MIVKICGVMDPEDAAFIARQGVGYIGCIAYARSQAYVTVAQAKEIAQAAQAYGAQPVAVFVDQPADAMQTYCEAAGISVVQLHSAYARGQGCLLPFQTIYAFTYREKHEPVPSNAICLYDNVQAGSGQPFDWKTFTPMHPNPWFLAGGLTPENIEQAVELLKPSGIDLSSGVRKQGSLRKDPEKIQRLLERIA